MRFASLAIIWTAGTSVHCIRHSSRSLWNALHAAAYWYLRVASLYTRWLADSGPAGVAMSARVSEATHTAVYSHWCVTSYLATATHVL
eukprot:5138278-Prorocentrum_lima.AAC.1